MKGLRGTPFDLFGYTAERRMERRLIRQYERDMAEVLKDPARNMDAAVALAELPLAIRGFGPVKEANAQKAAARREELLLAFRAGEAPRRQAAE
jgi:indolepyruvate ferredoxin oxidoreductase